MANKTIGLYALFLFLLTITVCITYKSNLYGPFVYDDLWQIVDSDSIKSDTLPQHNMRIITNLSFLFNKVCGQELADRNVITTIGSPSLRSWHLTNIILHIFCSCAFFALLRSYFKNLLVIPFLVCLFFALHPLNSEAVNYIQARAVILMTLFIILAALFWEKQRIVSIIFVIMAFLSKEVAIFYIFTLYSCYYLVYKQENFSKKKWIAFVIFFILLIIPFFSAVHQRFLTLNFTGNFCWQFIAYWHYLYLYFFPIADNLSMDHYYPKIYPSFWFVGMGVVGIVCLYIFSRKNRFIFFAFASSICILLPYVLIPTSFVVVEYRAYPLTIVFTLMVIGFFENIKFKIGNVSRLYKVGFYVLFCTVLLFLSMQTNKRSATWRSASEIYYDTIEKGSQQRGIHINLGTSYIVTAQVLWNYDKNLAQNYLQLGQTKTQELLSNRNVLSKKQYLSLQIQMLKIYEIKGEYHQFLLLFEKIKPEISGIKKEEYFVVLLTQAICYYKINDIKRAKEAISEIDVNILQEELKQEYQNWKKKINNN